MRSKLTGKTSLAGLPLFDRIALGLLFVYLAGDVIGGALRYYSVQLGLAWLSYAPALLLAASIAPLFVLYVATEGVTRTYLVVLLLFGVAATYGILNFGNPAQVAFGLWSLVPFLFGVVILPALVRSWRCLVPYAFTLWAISIICIFINLFYVWPWIGFHYQIGAAEVTASRLWAINGYNFARLPGFSEANYFVAPQVLVLAVFLRLSLAKRWRALIWTISGLAILLTTSKTDIFTFAILSVLWPFRRTSIRPLWRSVPIVGGMLEIALPFSSLLIPNSWFPRTSSYVGDALFGSFIDRMGNGWPVWIKMIVVHGSVLLGRGLGGIGTAQQHFEPALFSPSDNIAVFVFATFGIPGLVVLLWYARRVSRVSLTCAADQFFFVSACIVLIAGVTLSVMDSSVLGLIFGVSFRFVQERLQVASSASIATADRRPGTFHGQNVQTEGGAELL